MRARSRLVVVVTALVAVLVLHALPGQTSQTAGPPGAQPDLVSAVDLQLTVIDAIVGLGQGDTAATDQPELTPNPDATTIGRLEAPITIAVRVHNRSDATLTGAVGELTLHSRSTSRLAYHRAMDARSDEESGRPLGAVIGEIREPIADIPPGQTRLLTFRASPEDLGLPPADRDQAVHPLRIELQTDQGTPEGLTTALVVMGERPVRPLTGAAFVDLDTDMSQAALPDETQAGDDAVERRPWQGASPQSPSGPPADHSGLPPLATDLPTAQVDDLDQTAAALAELDIPLSVAVDNAVAAMTDRIEGVGLLLNDAAIERILTPFADADLVALHNRGLTELARRQLRLAAAAWPGTSARPERHIMVPRVALDATTVTGVVAPFGIDAVVLTEDMLQIDEDRQLPSSPSPVRPLEATDVTALVPDPWLTPLLAERSDIDPATIQRVVAETAVIYLERPGATETRGVLLAVPGNVDPPGITELLSTLRSSSWLRLATLSELHGSVTPDPPAQMDTELARQESLPADYVERLAASWESLSTLTEVLVASDPGLVDLRTTLLLAGSADFRDDLEAGRRLMAAVVDVSGELLSGVSVVGQPTVTFTDSEGQLPIVLRNNGPVPLSVRIELSSSRLRFPANGMAIELDADTTTTVLFDTEARSPGGTAPVDVTVTDPGGTRELAVGTLVVRIAAYPLLALVLVVASVGVLLLWWMRDLRGKRPRAADAA